MLKSIILFMGGIALFIYGITALSDYLKKATGNKFRSLIEKVVDKPLLSVLVAMLITLVTNSSSVVIILIVGLVRAGLMNSRQTIGLIIGINIGSTFAAFIISLPVGDYAYILLVIGLIFMFLSGDKLKNMGGVILSLGLLFVSLDIISYGITPLVVTDGAQELFLKFSSKTFSGSLLGFGFGTIFTAIVQSSAATNAIVQKLYQMDGAISLRGAIPIVIGANIGTTITGMLAALGGNEDSKRTSAIHTMFNVVGAIIFMSLLSPYTSLMQWFETNIIKQQYSMFTIATLHLFINVITGVVVLILIKPMIKLSELIVPYKEQRVTLVFDEGLISQSPEIALEFSKKAIDHLMKTTYEYFELTRNYSFTKNSKVASEADTLEMIIDELDGKIHNYLVKILRKGISNYDAIDLTKLLDITKDLERIGDHLSNIVEFFQIRYSMNHDLTDEGKNDLETLYEKLNEMLISVMESLYSNFSVKPTKVLQLEEEIDIIEEEARERYVKRLKEGVFDFYQTSNFTDILSDLERIGDHLNNIANIIIEPEPNNIEVTGLKTKIVGE